MEKVIPYVISSVDSGNLAAALVVAKEFCRKKNSKKLYERISKLFDNMFHEILNEKNNQIVYIKCIYRCF